MARLLGHLIEPPGPCPYLDGERSELEHYLLSGVRPDETEALLSHGYRRFGRDYFRPACSSCVKCEPTRIVTDRFAPSRTQRRIAKRNSGLRVEIGVPTIDAARIELYRAWHKDREHARDWQPSRMDEASYRDHFMEPHPCSREVAYFDGDVLVGVGFADETPNALSAIYFYFDPSRRKQSLGTFNVLTLVAWAKRAGKSYVYLGFKVEGCPSLVYKSTFHAQERLLGRPAFAETEVWLPVPTPR